MSFSDRDYSNTNEADLVDWSKDDKHAFGELYERYVKRIYNYCFYRTGNQHDAEDLTARVFMRAIKHIESYDDRGVPFSAWLYRIAHNLVANWHRDNSRHKIIPLDDFLTTKVEVDAPEVMTERLDEEQHLMVSVNRLPEDRQQLIFLKFVERLSNAEIGEIMDRTEGAIKSLYHRTLSSLHDDLISRGIGPLKNLGREKKQHRQKKNS